MLKYSLFVVLIPLLWISLNAHPTAEPRDDEDRTTDSLPGVKNDKIRLRRSSSFTSHLNPMGFPPVGVGILNPSLSSGALDPSLNPALNGGMFPGGGMLQGGGILPGTLTGSYPHGTQYQPNIGVPVGDHRFHTAVGITSHGGGGGGGGGGSGGGGGGGRK